MEKYERLTWSHGYNAERHPRNLGGDGLAFYCWNGEPGDDLDCVSDEGDAEENGGELIGWVYVDLKGKVFARFEQDEVEMADGHLRAAFEWVEEQNELTDPVGVAK